MQPWLCGTGVPGEWHPSHPTLGYKNAPAVERTPWTSLTSRPLLLFWATGACPVQEDRTREATVNVPVTALSEPLTNWVLEIIRKA